MSEALGFDGYSIDSAGSTAEALTRVELRTPELIVLDMRMPDDGPRFEAELKKRSLSAPIIAISANKEGAEWARAIGAHAFLAKPFDIDDLRTAVESVRQDGHGPSATRDVRHASPE